MRPHRLVGLDVVAAVQAQRHRSERRVHEFAVMRPDRIGMNVGLEEAAGATHPLRFDGSCLLQVQNDLAENAMQDGALRGIESGQGRQQCFGKFGLPGIV